MEIKATTFFDDKLVKDFIRFNTQKGKHYKIKRAAAFIMFFVLIAIVVYQVLNPVEGQALIPVGLWVVMLFMVIVFGVFIFFLYPSIVYRRAQNLIGTEKTYVFHKEEFFTSENQEDNTGIKYSSLPYVYETNRYFYLYINKSQAYMIDKSKISGGSAVDLHKVIAKHLPAGKYVVSID